MADLRLTAGVSPTFQQSAFLTSVLLSQSPVQLLPDALHRRDAEPAQLGEEVPVLHRGPPVSCGHRWDVHPGQETLPEAAARRLGQTDSGVQHRPQQRENRYAGVSERLPFPGMVSMAAVTRSLLPKLCCFFFFNADLLLEIINYYCTSLFLNIYDWDQDVSVFFLAFSKSP